MNNGIYALLSTHAGRYDSSVLHRTGQVCAYVLIVDTQEQQRRSLPQKCVGGSSFCSIPMRQAPGKRRPSSKKQVIEMNLAVELDDLRKTFTVSKGSLFKRTRREVVAVDGVSFAVPQGQSVALIGPNGAGKSTTIKMLTGILHPTSGNARVLGLVPWNERGRLAYHLGVVFGQRSQLWYHLPPSDTFNLLASVYGLDKAEFVKRRDMLIERFGLGPFLDT